MGPAYFRKYSIATVTATHITIQMIQVGGNDFALSADWTPATGDVKVTKNGGTPANIGTLPSYTSNLGWVFVFSAAELQCKRLDILVTDSVTKAVEDQFFSIETFGHASAMMPIDFSDIVRMGLTALPDAANDAAGGLPISDAGGLDLDSKLANTNEVTSARMGALTDWINGGRLDLLLDAIPTTAMRGTDIGSLNNISVADILATAQTYSVGAKGATRTVNQLLYELHALLSNKSVLLEVLTTYALNGTSAAKTYDLDDATNPTEIIEAT